MERVWGKDSTLFTEDDKEIALLVLGLALSSKEMLDALKNSGLKPSDFGARWMSVARAVLEGDRTVLSSEVKRLCGVQNGEGKLGFALIKAMSGRASRRRMSSKTTALSLRTIGLAPEKAAEIEAILDTAIEKLNQ